MTHEVLVCAWTIIRGANPKSRQVHTSVSTHSEVLEMQALTPSCHQTLAILRMPPPRLFIFFPPSNINILDLVRAPYFIWRSSSFCLWRCFHSRFFCTASLWFCLTCLCSLSFLAFWICAPVFTSTLPPCSCTVSRRFRLPSRRFCLCVRYFSSTWPWKGTTGLRLLASAPPSAGLSNSTVPAPACPGRRPPRGSRAAACSSSPTCWMRRFVDFAHFL
mmetsp:Transcript_29721/g.44456  ORF Transcript_29721/g.44456 Transcript_29721/m.44456 type:complete len:218 (+) Transcript_29721:161-814(+)